MIVDIVQGADPGREQKPSGETRSEASPRVSGHTDTSPSADPKILLKLDVYQPGFGPEIQKLPTHLEERGIQGVRTASTETEVLEHLPHAEIAILDRWNEKYFEAANKLEWIQAMSVGVDHYPLGAFARRGIRITTAGGVPDPSVAEHVYGCLLGLERGLFRARANKERRRWEPYRPGEVHGKTLAVIGVGNLGREISRKAAAFSMEVLGIDPQPDLDHPHVSTWLQPAELHDGLSEADYVVLACPLNERTDHLLAEREFRRMRDDAIVVNVARGRVVDQEALVEALREGQIRGAALDVFEDEPLPEPSPLWGLPNCILTPHVAGASQNYAFRLSELFQENLEAFKEGRSMINER